MTDTNGSTVSYAYNNLGKVSSTTVSRAVNGAAASVKTSNGYDTNTGRQISTYINNVISLRYGFTNGTLSDVYRHSVTGANTWQRYHLTTDAWGNTTRIQVQGSSGTGSDTPASWTTGLTLASYEYAGNNGYLSKMTYANGDYERYTYDRYGRLAVVDHYAGDGTLNYAEVYIYDGNGKTARCKLLDGDGTVTAEYRYEYDSLGRLIHSEALSGEASALSTEHLYDTDNRLTRQKYQLGTKIFTEYYKYNDNDGSLTSMTTATGDKLNYSYDGIKRLYGVAAKTGSTLNYLKAYTYAAVSGSQTSTRVSGIQYSGFTDAPTFGYAYTTDGNIASELKNGFTQFTYKYDNQGQLLEADGLQEGGIRYTYTYDAAGNILTAGRFHIMDGNLGTNTYTYEDTSWKDLLTAYNDQGIAYEGQTYNSATNTVSGTPISGNPVSYYNGNRWTFAWSNGRQLTSASKTGTTVTYAYDQNSIRTTKTVNGVKHTYTYASGRLLRETFGSTTIDFAYDANGAPYSMTHNGTKYFYITNLQGDVINLVNSVSNTVVATYTYDPYGNITSATGTMANANPLRYRGYYYDSETGFYYLQSRYYDPAICRFINADKHAGTGQGFSGYNMFAYCNGNPVVFEDHGGDRMNASIMVADSGKLDGQNRAKIRQIEAKKAEKTRLVVDVSNTIPLPVIHGKYGVSFVIDLVNGKIEIYPHAGGYIGNASGLSLSMGLVSNYDGDNSYAGTFIDANAGWIIGIDHCYSPDKP